MKRFAIIEIGSNNTKTHVYENDSVIYDSNVTIEFKKNYKLENKIKEEDFNKLVDVIKDTLKYTSELHVYGCSIFRNLGEEELSSINSKLNELFGINIEVVSQEDEDNYTALGCYNDIDYNDNICIFIGGGGSVELIFVNKREVVNKKYYDFGVVDITNTFESLKDDVPSVTFDEVYNYIDSKIGDIDFKADVLILAGGDHLYWYNNARYELIENSLYKSISQPLMLTKEMSDSYDHDALVTSLDRIRNNSDNPLWFDGSRAMKVITNLISHKVDAKYIIPTRINMEDGIKGTLK